MVKCILFEQGRRKSGDNIIIILKKLEVDTQSTKLDYKKNDKFVVDGLRATVYYGILGSPITLKATRKIPDDIPYNMLSIDPNGPLNIDDNEIIISYTENGITASINIPITVEDASYSSLVDHAITDKSRTASTALTNSTIGGGTIGTAIIG